MTWRISRVFGIDTARAASIARRVSSRPTSRWCPDTATMPREFCELMWFPEIPTNADRTLNPDRRSAASTAAATDCTVRSMSITTPLRSPSDGAWPKPMTSMPPLRETSPMRTQTFVVPTSMETRTVCSGIRRSSRQFSPAPHVHPRSQEVTADDRHILEDSPPEREQRDQVEVDAQPVAEERETRGEERVRVEARQEDARVEVPLQLGPERAEQRVERGEDAHCGVPRELDRKVELEGETEQHPGQQAEEREPQFGLLGAEDDAIGTAHVDVV